MKRLSIEILVVLLGIALAMPLAGCRSNTDKAKEFMQAGDNTMNDIKGESISLKELSLEIKEMIEAIFSGSLPPSKDVKKKVDEYRAAERKIEEYADRAIREYKKILTLKGVKYYLEYAEKGIEYVKTLKKLYEKYGEMLDYIVKALEEHESGKAIDSTSFSNAIQDSFNEMTKMSTEAESIENEIIRLNKEKNL